MKEGGGFYKGGEFERNTCRSLSLWASDGKSKSVFWRTDGSGSRADRYLATQHEEEDPTIISQLGDLCARDPVGKPFADKFLVEMKHHKNFGFEKVMMKGAEPEMFRVWRKLRKLAAQVKKHPLLIIKQNWCEIIVGVDRAMVYILSTNLKRPIVSFPREELTIFFFKDVIDVPFLLCLPRV